PVKGLRRAAALGVVSAALPALVRLRVLKDGGLPRHFALLEDALALLADALAGSKCLCGDEPTAADLAVYSALSAIAGLEGWERVTRAPAVIAWYGRMAAWDAQPPFGG
ncbi:MAG: glutathione S-transferase family protein, partial [Candidatus Methylomirabilis sp.]|nr:glutathione S-transferase family protein [Deltaproteobacteria bacterium]